MAPKKRPTRTRAIKDLIPSATELVLTEAAMADLKYLEPTRTRDRVISIVNELFLRVQALEHLHIDSESKRP